MRQTVQTEDSQGNVLFLVTNRFDLSCDEISDMYRSRWEIETFFKMEHILLQLTRDSLVDEFTVAALYGTVD